MIQKKIRFQKFNFAKIIKAQKRCLLMSAKAGVRESQKMMKKAYPKLEKSYVKKLSFFQIKGQRVLVRVPTYDLALIRLLKDKSPSAQKGVGVKERPKKMAYMGRSLKFIGLGRFVAIVKKNQKADVFEKQGAKLKRQELPGIFKIIAPKKQEVGKAMQSAYDKALAKLMGQI